MLVANRGEIAVRIIRTCRDLGIETVLVHSDVDRDSLGFSMADRTLCVGPAPATKSYLNAEAILAAAFSSGADAIHPGYGFLAENAMFVAACEDQGMLFVGPGAEAVRLMGNKIAARVVADRIGIPIIPGSKAAVAIPDARRIADEIGYPVILKAAGGGGGRGMRLVDSGAQIEDTLASASSEAASAFADNAIYVEKYLQNARHIEIQVAADQWGNVIHLGERDCTIQRRYQKLVEEGPSAAIDDETRERMCEAAIRLCREVSYRGVGTVEFLFDRDTSRFYFMEMNTRLQVEHPVTELLTGLDLVEMQFAITAGRRLPVRQEDVRIAGHAIEFRINAEDPSAGFRPAAGTLEQWVMPQGLGVRVDSHCYPNYRVPPYYDSLLAKVIVIGPTREAAIARARRALSELQVGGIASTLLFHRWLLDCEEFKVAATNTSWVEHNERAWIGDRCD